MGIVLAVIAGGAFIAAASLVDLDTFSHRRHRRPSDARFYSRALVPSSPGPGRPPSLRTWAISLEDSRSSSRCIAGSL